MVKWSSVLLRIPMTLHGWDPLRILAQMTALQCIHYILLAAFVPPLLSIFTEPAALRFEGGPAQVGMIMDWREVASKPTWDWHTVMHLVNMYTGWSKTGGESGPAWTPSEQVALSNWTAGAVWLHVPDHRGGLQPYVLPPTSFQWNDSSPSLANDLSTESLLTSMAEESLIPAARSLRSPTAFASSPTSLPSSIWPSPRWFAKDASRPSNTSGTLLQQEHQLEMWEYRRTHDARRGWAISAAWMLTVVFDVQVLYYLVRKPTHVLDFVCTMHFVHFILTTSFAGALPHSVYWWVLMMVHASLCIVFAERIAIQREMRMGFTDHTVLDSSQLDEDTYELLPSRSRGAGRGRY